MTAVDWQQAARELAPDDLALDHVLPPITLTDWRLAYERPPVDALVEGLLFPGRWTAAVAAAKTGKSTLALHIAHRLARGLEPFTDSDREPVAVLYLDGEMGELDTVERTTALGLTPDDLTRLAYSDIVPKGDTLPGGAAIVSTAAALDAELVVLDGMNAFVTGAENNDEPWRALFEQTIAPLKRAGRAVLTTDNTGHTEKGRGRGSSVKLDKADGIVVLSRTDDGVKLTTKYQRTQAYARELALRMTGRDGASPLGFHEALFGAWPAGTSEMAALLDSLGVHWKAGRDIARRALVAGGHTATNEVLCAAVRWRKNERTGPRTGADGQIHGQV